MAEVMVVAAVVVRYFAVVEDCNRRYPGPGFECFLAEESRDSRAAETRRIASVGVGTARLESALTEA